MKKLIKTSTQHQTVVNSVQFAVISAIASVALLLTACQKEALVKVDTPTVNQPVNPQSGGAVAQKIGPAVTYNACGMSVNVFSPSEFTADVYSFAYNINGQQKRFAINTYGDMDFSKYDKFSFEFAGYLDTEKKVKFWRLKRTDGKYLTRGLKYADKITGTNQADQFFLLSSVGNNQYKLLMPKLPVCNVVAIWNDIDRGYSIANFDYNSYKLPYMETKITMTIIPLTNG